MDVPVSAGVIPSDSPMVLNELLSGSLLLMPPSTRLAWMLIMSLGFRVSRKPVCNAGMALNMNEREYSQFLFDSVTSAPAVVLNLPASRVTMPQRRWHKPAGR